MTWLTENWIWVLFGLAFVAMHLFGHGCHGGHGGHGSGTGGDADKTTAKQRRANSADAQDGSRDAHRH